jgi:predicted phosphate transport protein (TIGR00153 family)
MAHCLEFDSPNRTGWRPDAPTATLAMSNVRGSGSRDPPEVNVPSFRLIPRDERFFDLFVEDAANVLDGARQLETMLRTFDTPDKSAKKIREIEHRGDDISHNIGHRLEATFVTPFDREEIHALVSGLDDILDLVEEVSDTFVLYNISAPTKTSVKQASLIVQCCDQIHQALSNLRGFKDLDRFVIEIHRLENEGDRLERSAIAALFDDGTKTIDVLKWKDIYALLEDTIDKCEDVAQMIERIVVKHA